MVSPRILLLAYYFQHKICFFPIGNSLSYTCINILMLTLLFHLIEELNSSKSEDSLNPGESSSTMLSGDSAGLGDEWDEDIPGDGEIELNDLPNVRYDAREQLLSPEIQEEATDQYGQCVLKIADITNTLIGWLVLKKAEI